MKKTIVAICDIVIYIIVFIVLQSICVVGFQLLIPKDSAMALILGQGISAILTIIVFVLLHWTHIGMKEPKNSIPLFVLVAIFALGTLFPSTWLNELSGVELPKNYEEIFEKIMSSPLGYVSVSLIVPIAEEMLFRGGILRRLLDVLCPKDGLLLTTNEQNNRHWLAITISALLFGLLHGNIVQGAHAFLMGLFLGWIYYRTNSILPGLIFHWVNNTAAVLISVVTNTGEDAKLIEVFGGNTALMDSTIVISTIVFILTLWRINKKTL